MRDLIMVGIVLASTYIWQAYFEPPMVAKNVGECTKCDSMTMVIIKERR